MCAGTSGSLPLSSTRPKNSTRSRSSSWTRSESTTRRASKLEGLLMQDPTFKKTLMNPLQDSNGHMVREISPSFQNLNLRSPSLRILRSDLCSLYTKQKCTAMELLNVAPVVI